MLSPHSWTLNENVRLKHLCEVVPNSPLRGSPPKGAGDASWSGPPLAIIPQSWPDAEPIPASWEYRGGGGDHQDVSDAQGKQHRGVAFEAEQTRNNLFRMLSSLQAQPSPSSSASMVPSRLTTRAEIRPPAVCRPLSLTTGIMPASPGPRNIPGICTLCSTQKPGDHSEGVGRQDGTPRYSVRLLHTHPFFVTPCPPPENSPGSLPSPGAKETGIHRLHGASFAWVATGRQRGCIWSIDHACVSMRVIFPFPLACAAMRRDKLPSRKVAVSLVTTLRQRGPLPAGRTHPGTTLYARHISGTDPWGKKRRMEGQWFELAIRGPDESGLFPSTVQSTS